MDIYVLTCHYRPRAHQVFLVFCVPNGMRVDSRVKMSVDYEHASLIEINLDSVPQMISIINYYHNKSVMYCFHSGSKYIIRNWYYCSFAYMKQITLLSWCICAQEHNIENSVNTGHDVFSIQEHTKYSIIRNVSSGRCFVFPEHGKFRDELFIFHHDDKGPLFSFAHK